MSQSASVTHIVGGNEISRDTTGALVRVKRYLGAVVVIQQPNTPLRREYILTTAQGTTHRVAGNTGALPPAGSADNMAFDAWGSRRSFDSWAALTLAQELAYSSPSATRRGYTGHEQVDSVGLIHMNGRMYDPRIGRFIQADPIIQDPYTGQSFNRYTYVFNNPLANTDPSGNISVGNALRMVAAIAITVYTGGAASGLLAQGLTAQAIATAAMGGFVAGAVQTGTLRGALIGGLQAGLTFGLAGGMGPIGEALKAGAVGGVMAELQGGNFGHGFAAAGFGSLASRSPIVRQISGSPEGRIFASAVIGGTASRIAGGKFANGAVTAAFASAFGQAASRGRGEPTLEELTHMSSEELQAAVIGSSDTWIAYEDTSALARWSGAAAGADAAQYWADLHVQTGNPAYAVPGAFAALWTPDTAASTALTLTPAAAARTIGGWAGRYFFGKGALLNSGRYLRIGLGRDGGNSVVRVGGEWLGKVPAPIRNFVGIQELKPGVWKWDLWNRGPL